MIYYLFADNMEINSSSNCLFEAIQQLFALYFVFNITYPKTGSLSLEFMQRYFFDLHPTATRGQKKNILSMSKVINLLDKIRRSGV